MISKDLALNILAGIAFCGAVGMSVAAVQERRGVPDKTGGVLEEAARENAWRTYAATGRTIGPANAPATITVFSDFQCPFCARLASELKTLRQRNPDQIAIVFRHTPLVIHPYATLAAAMSECAGDQGRFENMHYLLFEDQDFIGKRPPSKWIRRAQVADSSKFADCMRDTAPIFARIRRDAAVGQQLGLTGTPLVLVNDRRFNGTPDLPTLQRVVDEVIQAHLSKAN